MRKGRTAVHKLKTDSWAFKYVVNGLKAFELRKNDRDYQAGDYLLLQETKHTAEEMANGSPLVYTGKEINVQVTHVLHGPMYGLKEGWVIMSIEL